MDTCATCRWFQPVVENRPGTGYCRKNAPVSYVLRDGTPAPRWPKVVEGDRCGKFMDRNGQEVAA
jgi:hypothetical protein